MKSLWDLTKRRSKTNAPAESGAAPQVPPPQKPPLRVAEVFGLDRGKNPLSYVVRQVEKDFLEALEEGTNVALVVHGTSKQGKSSLLRHALSDRPHISLDGNSGVPPEALYREMLNQCGVMRVTGTEVTGNAEIGANAGWVAAKVSASGTVTHEPVAIDIANPSSVARILAQATDKRLIVIDNFHHLDTTTQQAFATAIRSFEKHFKFVIIGTWNNSGYLQKFNQELMGTTREFTFSKWSVGDLYRVLDAGAPLLKVKLANTVKQSLIDRSALNVSLLQELTKKYLRACGVEQTCDHETSLSDTKKVEVVAGDLERDNERQVMANLRMIASIGTSFVAGRTRSYWILQAFLGAQEREIVNGMPSDDLFTKTNELLQSASKAGAPQLPKGEFSNLIRTTWLKEQRKAITSPILVYDHDTGALVISDSWTKFVLRSTKRSKIRKDL
jgi:hypothetical protein